eukprot:gene40535-49410_t
MKFISLTILCVSLIAKINATVDYTCLHSESWMLNENGGYSSIFSADTDILTSAYVDSTRRHLRNGAFQSQRLLQGGPPGGGGGGGGGGPPGGGGGGGGGGGATDTGAAVGWKVTFKGIPSYAHTMTSSDVTALDSRPKAATDFDSGHTTAV